MKSIVSIVEGHGEVDALPKLIHRIASNARLQSPIVHPPFRVKADLFLRFTEEFERIIIFQTNKARIENAVLIILLDCDDGCVAEVGPRIRAEVERICSDVSFLVCLAFREFESWFIYSAESLAESGLLLPGTVPPEDPDAIGDAKGWISKHMDEKYRETSHQMEFSARIDVQAASQSSSFKRLNRLLVAALS